MAKVYVFVNQKGGVGKTTSVINIGAYIAESGKRTLLIDFDSQANMTSGVGVAKQKPTIYELLADKATPAEIVRKTCVPNLFAIPSSIDLSGATVELANREGRDFYLKNALAPFMDDYDYILVDCPPSLGILTINGLAAAQKVFIPMQCEYFALEGMSLLLGTIKRIQSSVNPGLKIGGIFFTMYDSRTKLAHDVINQVRQYFPNHVFSTIIPRNVRLSEAPSHGMPICKYDGNCAGAKSYKELTAEILQNG